MIKMINKHEISSEVYEMFHIFIYYLITNKSYHNYQSSLRGLKSIEYMRKEGERARKEKYLTKRLKS